MERGGLAYWVAAIRECFEEAGLLLCRDASGELVRFEHPEIEARYAERRAALNARRLSFVDFCRSERLRLAVDRLTYAFGHLVSSFNPEDPHHADSGEEGTEVLASLGFTGETMEVVHALAEHVAGDYAYTGEATETRRRIESGDL